MYIVVAAYIKGSSPKLKPIRHQQIEQQNAPKFRLHPDFMNQTGMHPLGEEEVGDEGRAWKNFRGGGGK